MESGLYYFYSGVESVHLWIIRSNSRDMTGFTKRSSMGTVRLPCSSRSSKNGKT